MRYRKGTIAISERQDVELLSQVLHAGFIRHNQLGELLVLRRAEKNRHSFCWRVRRLVDHGLLSQHTVTAVGSDPIYSITQPALDQLSRCGRFYADAARQLRDSTAVAHALELADIHLALLRGGTLSLWMSEIEIRSRNRLGVGEFAKDYDAVVDVVIDGSTATFALEYECTLKGARQYDEIRAAIACERGVSTILYLAPSYQLVTWLARTFAGVRQRLLFATTAKFKRELLDTEVIHARQERSFRLRDVLSAVHNV